MCLRQLLATARELSANEQYEHAAALYRYALCWRSRAATIWLALGSCHEALGQHDVAIRIYEAARSVLRPRSNDHRSRILARQRSAEAVVVAPATETEIAALDSRLLNTHLRMRAAAMGEQGRASRGIRR